MDAKKKIAIGGGAVTAALVGSLLVLGGGDDPKQVKPAPPTVLTTDLLSPEVAPGAQVTTGACYSKDKQVAGITLTGEASGRFLLGEIRYVAKGDVLCFEVTATNLSTQSLRLTADVRYIDGEPEVALVKAAPVETTTPEEPAEALIGDRISDLDSPPVKPGATTTVTVTLPKGAEVKPKSLVLRDPAFHVVSEKVDGDVYSVTVKNTSKREARLAADFAYRASQIDRSSP